MTRNIVSLLLLLIIITPLLHAQDTTQLKRAPYRLKVAVDKKTVYEEDLKEAPYVLPDNTLQLYPGETVYIEIEQTDGVIKGIKAVKEIKDPAKTVAISFSQSVNRKTHELMMLRVSNPFGYKLSYKATIYLLNHKKWANTNVYPVPAGLSGFETWPDLITSIGLGNWALQK